MSPTVKTLREWLATLPPEMDDACIASAVGPWPSMAKRVIAYGAKDGSCSGVVVNSMGTHLSDDWYKDVEIISILQ